MGELPSNQGKWSYRFPDAYTRPLPTSPAERDRLKKHQEMVFARIRRLVSDQGGITRQTMSLSLVSETDLSGDYIACLHDTERLMISNQMGWIASWVDQAIRSCQNSQLHLGNQLYRGPHLRTYPPGDIEKIFEALKEIKNKKPKDNREFKLCEKMRYVGDDGLLRAKSFLLQILEEGR